MGIDIGPARDADADILSCECGNDRVRRILRAGRLSAFASAVPRSMLRGTSSDALPTAQDSVLSASRPDRRRARYRGVRQTAVVGHPAEEALATPWVLIQSDGSSPSDCRAPRTQDRRDPLVRRPSAASAAAASPGLPLRPLEDFREERLPNAQGRGTVMLRKMVGLRPDRRLALIRRRDVVPIAVCGLHLGRTP